MSSSSYLVHAISCRRNYIAKISLFVIFIIVFLFLVSPCYFYYFYFLRSDPPPATRYPLPATRHPLPATHLPATRHPSPVTRHQSPATSHPPPVTRHLSPAEKSCRAICTKRSCDIIFMKITVLWFCLRKTVSGSYLKQNSSNLVSWNPHHFLEMSKFVAGRSWTEILHLNFKEIVEKMMW